MLLCSVHCAPTHTTMALHLCLFPKCQHAPAADCLSPWARTRRHLSMGGRWRWIRIAERKRRRADVSTTRRAAARANRKALAECQCSALGHAPLLYFFTPLAHCRYCRRILAAGSVEVVSAGGTQQAELLLSWWQLPCSALLRMRTYCGYRLAFLPTNHLSPAVPIRTPLKHQRRATAPPQRPPNER